ncbi:MAG: ComEC/Rec2 family competence protein [Flammeovirgaceae bacterium]|jgi:competence protein ComEC|nr:ComEC/Rec2 family competence protein [Flammeovirgaceae bacterium]
MFSIFALREIGHRKSNIYNTIALTAFLLLLSEPHLVYSISFQLSFVAVTGIVIFHPIFYNKIKLKN